ncbi:MAG: class I SAM-dependent methyltransferase [Acidimicrobiia bacterium]
MRTSTLRNVARNALRPHYLPVMARKVAARLRPSHRDAALRWADSHAESVAEFAIALDPDLWAESEAWADEFRVAARQRLDERAVPLGGGGHFQLVHFLVRYLQPRVVLETGVAAGYTSQAILSALELNGRGTLYSSDFPYFRLDAPEKYVGVLVDDALRDRWHLGLNGDRVNLAEFMPQMDQIDFVHYDSDKSVEGREFVMDAITSKLSPGAVVVMDDIDDNTFFRDWVTRSGAGFRVFARGRKYVGLTGL